MKRDQIVYLDDILDSIEMINQYTKNIKVFNFNKRRGKPHVINDLAEAAKGEILIFCDANTLYDKEAIKNLVKNYNDARIGGVSGKLNLIDFEKAKIYFKHLRDTYNLPFYYQSYDSEKNILSEII